MRSERWKEVLDARADKMDPELLADIGMALTEVDEAEDNAELDAKNAEIDSLHTQIEELKRSHAETINKLIYRGEKPDDMAEATVSETVEEIEDPYEVLYGGNE